MCSNISTQYRKALLIAHKSHAFLKKKQSPVGGIG